MPEQLTKRDLRLLIQMSDLNVASDLRRFDELAEASQSFKRFVERLVAEKILAKWQFSELLKGRTQFHLGKYELKCLIEDRRPWMYYLADHLEMGRSVTIQVQSLDRTDGLRRFRENARRLAALNHPNVAHIYDFDEAQNQCFVVLEERKGTTMHRYLRRNDTLNSRTAARFLGQLASGLNYLHQAEIVHGNLCASNILIDKSDRLLIWGVGEVGLLHENNTRPSDEEFAKETKCFGKLAYETAKAAGDDSIAVKLRQLAKQMVVSNHRSELLRRFPQRIKKLLTDVVDAQQKLQIPETETRPPVKTQNRNWKVPVAVVCAMLVVAASGYTIVKMKDRSTRQFVHDKVNESLDPITVEPKSTSDVVNNLRSAGLNHRTSTKDDEIDSVESLVGSTPQEEANSDQFKTTKIQTSATSKNLESQVDTESSLPGGALAHADVPVINDDQVELELPFDPFELLTTTFDLPNSNQNVDQIIGKLAGLREDDEVFINLLGGETAHRGKFKFTMKQKTKGEWLVSIERSEKSESIAEVMIREGHLIFRWQPEIHTPSIANHLRNCVLQLKHADFEHALRLRDHPATIEPIVLSCDGDIYRKNLPIPSLPHPDQLRLEVTDVNNVIPEVEGDLPLRAEKDELSVRIGQKKEKPIEFRISFSTKRRPELKIAPFFLVPSSEHWSELNLKSFAKTKREIEFAFDSIPDMKKKVEDYIDRMERDGAKESVMAAIKAERKAQEELVKDGFEHFKTLQNLCSTIHLRAKMRVRIFFVVGEQEIDLLVTQPFENE